MALVTKPFGTRPNAGADFHETYATAPLMQLGQMFHGSDGHDWRLVRNGATQIAADTAITVADTTFLAAAGAGPYKTPPATVVPANHYFWARLTALTA